jgi:predicted glycosyltransferase
MPKDIYDELKDTAKQGTIIERSRPDLPAVIQRADLSISQAGYNTIAEIMSAGTPSVVIPYAGGVETEQTLRAALLSKRGLLQVIDEKQLTATILDKAMHQALITTPTKKMSVNLEGAKLTANILQGLL